MERGVCGMCSPLIFRNLALIRSLNDDWLHPFVIQSSYTNGAGLSLSVVFVAGTGVVGISSRSPCIEIINS